MHSLLPWYASDDEEDAAPPLSSSSVIGGDYLLGDEDSVDSAILDAVLMDINYTYEQLASKLLSDTMTMGGDEQMYNPG